jgi:hypothetical protein
MFEAVTHNYQYETLESTIIRQQIVNKFFEHFDDILSFYLSTHSSTYKNSR